MSTTHAAATIALVGNPNTGKSTLFGGLAGVRQRVGNYPGVTVEKKLGTLLHGDTRMQLVDLPGTYSLAPRSLDEMLAVDVLLGRRSDVPPVDVVLAIVDAANLERNLYLVSQVLELGRPVVVALNMIDVARQRGIEIDVEGLQERLGVPVVPVQANKRIGLEALKRALAATSSAAPRGAPQIFPEPFLREVEQLEGVLAEEGLGGTPRYLTERLLLDSGGYVEGHLLGDDHDLTRAELTAARQRLADAGLTVPGVEAVVRYGWVQTALEGVVVRPARRATTPTDRIDRVLTHKVWGTLVFALAMLAVFSSIFLLADVPMTWIDAGMGLLAGAVESVVPAGAFRSLLVDGVIGGVGAVVIFLPQILILFFFIALLEDCGYMARAAYLMDKLMVRVGLSGKSFIPLLSSFACAVPGIMATRVIEDRRDRLTTIMIAPLMSCSARLPVYAILIGAFMPQKAWLQGLTFFCMYLVGIVAAVIAALLLRKTLLRGEPSPFVMELPAYKCPSLATVLHRMFERGWAFIRRAGTIVFAVAILVWAAAYYPRSEAEVAAEMARQRDDAKTELAALAPTDPARDAAAARLASFDDPEQRDNMAAAAQLRYSLLGRMGRGIEPVVRPLGWDWRIGCAAIASFPAREVVMGVLGVIYNMGGEVDVGAAEDQSRLQAHLREARWDETGEPVYNIPVALSIMVFFALCAQCAATLAVIRRETNSWRWPIFTFVYMTVLAYLGALVTYQVGMLLT